MQLDISSLRLRYVKNKIVKEDLNADPIIEFTQWLGNAVQDKILEPNAMTLCTVDAYGKPSTRTVLLKKLDHGFCFFTNYRSKKAQDLSSNLNVALNFHWAEQERQVNVLGTTEKLLPQENATYFYSRPFESQIGAWVSEYQSSEIPDRAELDAKEIALKKQFKNSKVIMPDFWGGYRVIPKSIEFWQGRESRLHDRILYQRKEDFWKLNRLSP